MRFFREKIFAALLAITTVAAIQTPSTVLALSNWDSPEFSGSVQINPASPLPGVPPSQPYEPKPLVFPLFLEGNHFSSMITLVNNSNASTYADVAFRRPNREVFAKRRMKFDAHSQRRIETARVLAEFAPSTNAGSVLVTQDPGLKGPSINGVLSFTYQGDARPSYIDEEPFMAAMMGSRSLEGVSDAGEGDPIVAVTSISPVSQQIQIECFGETTPKFLKRFRLRPGATLLRNACADDHSFGEDLGGLSEIDEGRSGQPLGIRITSDGMPGSFAAYAIMKHKQNGERYFSSILFSDPKTLNSPNSIFAGVPVGFVSSVLPDGTYTPNLFLANFSEKDIHAVILLAGESDGITSSHEVASVTVRARSTTHVIIPAVQRDLGVKNSFIVKSSGKPGDLIVKFVAKGDSGLKEVELQAKDEGDIANAGTHPWSIEHGVESTLLLFNHGKETQVVTVKISGPEARWQKEYQIGSMQTMALDIRALIDTHTADDQGRVLPETTSTGEVNWIVSKLKQVSGRLMQSDATTLHGEKL